MFNKILFEDKEFKIIKSCDYVVVRKNNDYSFHSHFKRYSGAIGLIKLFYKKIQPNVNYFNIAMQRITTEKEFNSFITIRLKQKYYNRCN